MKLYIVVYEVLDGEANWFFVVKNKMDQNIADKLALSDYNECIGGEPEDLGGMTLDDIIGNVWYETVTVEGYDIKLDKMP